MYPTLWTLVPFCVLTVHGLRLPIPEDFMKPELTDVVFKHESSGDRMRRHVTDTFPIKINVQITVAKELVSMDLSMNIKHNQDDVPLYMYRDGKTTRVDAPASKKYALYQNFDNDGSFLVTIGNEVDKMNTSKQIFGTFRYNSSVYVIQPSNETIHQHTVSKIPDQTLTFESRQPRVLNTREPIISLEENIPSHLRDNIRRKRQSTKYEIELFSVVDYKSYQFWYDLTVGPNRPAETVQLIMQYIAYLINSVDSRYKTIPGDDFVVDVLTAGVYIADRSTASPWSSNKATNNKLPTDVALDDFTAWVQDQRSLPQYDHAMGFTGYDAVSSSAGSDSSGIAFSKALCTNQKTSVVEESFNFITMTTAAHELGHSLGADHDGQFNNCNGADNYIMASVNSISGDSSVTSNMWSFSKCSADSFKSYIAQLDRTGNNCMLSTSSGSRPATTLRPMAEVYGPDTSCVNTIGNGSFVCRSIQNYATICTGMYCNQPGTTQCYSIIPAEGTPCGKGKWCEKGECVQSTRAPADNFDDCPIGDRPGLFDNADQTCEEWIAAEPGRCYGSYTRATCCKSCHAYLTTDETCLYGDTARESCEAMGKRGCYNNEDYCCGTCKALVDLSRPDCAYGDKFLGCVKSDCDRYSQTDRLGCCETCYDPTNTTPRPSPTTTTQKQTTPTTRTTKPVTTPTRRTTKTTPRVTTGKTDRTVTPTDTDKPTGSTTEVVVETTTPAQSEWIIVAVGCGAGVLVVVILVIVLCVFVKMKRAKKSGSKPKPTQDNSYDNIGFTNMGASKPNYPPPRRGSSSSQQHSGGMMRPTISIINNGSLGEHPDGYMKPVHLTADSGVQYSAPNKPKKPLVPPKRYGNEPNNTKDSNRPQSKPIHYKKTGHIPNVSSSESNHFSHNGVQSGNAIPGRKFSDAYDSIGELQQALQYRRPTLPQNHPSTLRSNKTISGTSNNPSEKSDEATKGSFPDNMGNKLNNNRPKVLPTAPPRPVPRTKINAVYVYDSENESTQHSSASGDFNVHNNAQARNSHDTNIHVMDTVALYDTADAIKKESPPHPAQKTGNGPLLPPQKPVPRRQLSEPKSPDTQAPTGTKHPLKPPMKPVPRRQTSTENANSGYNNPSFNFDDRDEVQI